MKAARLRGAGRRRDHSGQVQGQPNNLVIGVPYPECRPLHLALRPDHLGDVLEALEQHQGGESADLDREPLTEAPALSFGDGPESRSQARAREWSGTRTGRWIWGPDGRQNAFGRGLSVTAMRLVAGYAAIGNGGELVTPHVLAGWNT